MMNAERLMLIGALVAFLLTVHWVRSRDLRERFAIWWLIVGSLLLLPGLMPESIKSIATALNLSYPSLVLVIACILAWQVPYSLPSAEII